MTWKDTSTEISKLAATVGVDTGLHNVDFPGLHSPFGAVINEILVALLSAALVVLLTNGIFERPRLIVRWSRRSEPEVGPAIRYAPEVLDSEEFFRINCTLEGKSLLARLLSRRGHYDGLFLDIRYAPSDALILGPDQRRGARVGVVANGGIQLRMNDLPAGAPSWATFTLKIGAVPPGQLSVTVVYAFLRPQGTIRWFDKHVLRRDAGVEVITAVRSS